MSSSSEKADLLFKASLGFPSTNKEFAFFQESASANNYLLGEEVLVDSIPDTPSFSGGTSITYTLSDSSTSYRLCASYSANSLAFSYVFLSFSQGLGVCS